MVDSRLHRIPPAAIEPMISSAEFQCIGCGYDLSGTPVGGTCPECGEPVATSLRAVDGTRACSTATTSMVMGILSLVLCQVFGPVAIILYFSAMKQINSAC